MDHVHTVRVEKETPQMIGSICGPLIETMRDYHFCQPSVITNKRDPSLLCPHDGANMVIDEEYDSPHVGTMYICPECGYHDNVYVIDENKLVEKIKTKNKIWDECDEDQMPICEFHDKMKERCGGIITVWELKWIYAQGT